MDQDAWLRIESACEGDIDRLMQVVRQNQPASDVARLAPAFEAWELVREVSRELGHGLTLADDELQGGGLELLLARGPDACAEALEDAEVEQVHSAVLISCQVHELVGTVLLGAVH